MSPEQFCYWLQGFVELSPDMKVPSEKQWKAIKEHINTVFLKVTPEVLPDDCPLEDKKKEEVKQPFPPLPDTDFWKELAEKMKKGGLPNQPLDWPKPFPYEPYPNPYSPGTPWRGFGDYPYPPTIIC